MSAAEFSDTITNRDRHTPTKEFDMQRLKLWFPGRYDAAILAAWVTSFLFWGVMIAETLRMRYRANYGWPATHLDPDVWSTLMGFCFVASLDMWTILGDGPLWRRSLISLAIGLVCGMGLTVGWWPHEATTAERLAFGGYVASQRLFVLAASAVLSVIAQLCSRRRLTFRPNQKRSAVSIADIMVCTMLVAVAISVFIRMYRWADDGEVFAELAITWAAIEVFVAVILLLPTFFFFHWRLFPLTTLFSGVIVSAGLLVFNYFVRQAKVSEDERSNLIVFVAGSFPIGLALALTKLWGLKLVRTWDANGETSQKSVRWNMRTSASLTVLLLVGSLLVRFHFLDFRVLITAPWGEKWHVHQRVCKVSRLTNITPNGADEDYAWTAGSFDLRREYFHSFGGFSVSVNSTDVTPEMVRWLLGPTNRLFFYQGAFDDHWCQALSGHRIDRLFIEGMPTATPANFVAFCKSSNIAELILRNARGSADFLCELRKHKKLESLEYSGPVNQSLIDEFAHLPLTSLDCWGNERIEFTELSRLKELRFSEREVDVAFLDSINMSMADEYLLSITFDECQFSAESLSHLEKVGLPMYEVKINMKELVTLADTDFLSLAHAESNVTIVSRTHEFESEFQLRREATWHGLTSGLDLQLAETDEAFVAELEKVASIERDASGDVKAIDIQGVFIKPDTIRRMRAFAPNLKHLRIDIAYQSDEALDEIGKWPKLESLEIPAYLADVPEDESTFDAITQPTELYGVLPLKSVAKLTRLKRLQLPFGLSQVAHQMELGEFAYHPERLVLPKIAVHTFREGTFLFRDELVRSELVIENELYEVNELKSLQNLEYLFLPGYMLVDSGFGMLRSFPKLKTLHAPFAYAEISDLEILATQTQIQDLATGVVITSPEDPVIQIIANMTHLKRLPLTVIADDDLDGEGKAVVENQIRSQLPDCDVTFYFLPYVD